MRNRQGGKVGDGRTGLLAFTQKKARRFINIGSTKPYGGSAPVGVNVATLTSQIDRPERKTEAFYRFRRSNRPSYNSKGVMSQW